MSIHPAHARTLEALTAAGVNPALIGQVQIIATDCAAWEQEAAQERARVRELEAALDYQALDDQGEVHP
jgi:hypothetical protein